jgi:hypothetical protein
MAYKQCRKGTDNVSLRLPQELTHDELGKFLWVPTGAPLSSGDTCEKSKTHHRQGGRQVPLSPLDY